jgi:hypothetical protein
MSQRKEEEKMMEEKTMHTTKESLHLDTPHPTCCAVPECHPFNIDDALPSYEQFKLAVGLANVIELDPLTHSIPLTRGPFI